MNNFNKKIAIIVGSIVAVIIVVIIVIIVVILPQFQSGNTNNNVSNQNNVETTMNNNANTTNTNNGSTGVNAVPSNTNTDSTTKNNNEISNNGASSTTTETVRGYSENTVNDVCLSLYDDSTDVTDLSSFVSEIPERYNTDSNFVKTFLNTGRTDSMSSGATFSSPTIVSNTLISSTNGYERRTVVINAYLHGAQQEAGVEDDSGWCTITADVVANSNNQIVYYSASITSN